LYEKDETTGKTYAEILSSNGIIPGIKVDKGVRVLANTDGETVTQGMDDLGKRCAEYYAAGARFAKWRAVLHIKDSGAPTQLAIDANAYTLARYASICQENGLVPIVEPEVLMDGTHSIERSAEVTQRVLAACFKALADHHVVLEGILLKPNMVRSGTTCVQQAGPADIARCTVRVLQNTCPPALPGVTFLSGGMSEETATVALDCINKFGDKAKKPWSLTFSYGRALQQSVLKAWKGDSANIKAAQEQLMIRAKANSEAQRGIYEGSGKEGAAASASLHVANYTY
jgi:fructose-bisphosphate aldolase, class I